MRLIFRWYSTIQPFHLQRASMPPRQHHEHTLCQTGPVWQSITRRLFSYWSPKAPHFDLQSGPTVQMRYYWCLKLLFGHLTMCLIFRWHSTIQPFHFQRASMPPRQHHVQLNVLVWQTTARLRVHLIGR